MPIARIGTSLLHFVHIPKAGGTSVEAYLRAKGPLCLLEETRTGWSPSPPQHMHRAVHETIVPPEFCDAAFAVLRDPLARLQSEFRYKSRGEPPAAHGVRSLVRRLKDGSGIRREEAQRIRLNKRWMETDFDHWANEALQICARDPGFDDNHFRPQVDFVSADLKLFRLEDGLDPIFRWIDEVTDTDPLPAPEPANVSRNIPITVSPHTEKRVRDFYAEDYALMDSLRNPA